MAIPFGNAEILQESHNKFTVYSILYTVQYKISTPIHVKQ